MLTKKEERRLKALIGQPLGAPDPITLILALKCKHKYGKQFIKDAKELYRLLLKYYGENILEFNKHFYTYIHNWKRIIELEKPIYDAPKKPLRKRQDNKTEINYGSGGSNGKTIRYPKKCRKTAWKRFYKLFPMLDPNLSEEEKKQWLNNKHNNKYPTEAEKILNKK